VRDAARHYDVVAGPDRRDPWSLPAVDGWERNLGTHDLAGRTVAIVPDLGGVPLDPGVEDRLRAAADELISATGMKQVDVEVHPPNLAAQWMIGNFSTLLAELGDLWPGCADDLTEEVAIGMRLSESLYNLHTAAAAEQLRIEANETMAVAFDQADFVIAATNPGPAFEAHSPMSSSNGGFIDKAKAGPAGRAGFRAGTLATRVGSGIFPKLPNRLIDHIVDRFPDLVAMGGLTIISNVYGNPAVSIPAGQVDGLPVGMQVLAPHHNDALLFDVALAAERTMPWPKVAPSVTLTGSTSSA
jgi:Asp-tRNA(Asn)/Glu-tRNA(Gln) amidotransferase A subunit family amidase